MKEKKIKSVAFNNRKKQLTVRYASGKTISVHYGHFGFSSPLARAWVDKETRGQSIGLEFADGTMDYIPYDQPLAAVKDADFILQHQIEVMISIIKDEIKARKLSKKYLAEQLKTSDNQIQRLLNPKILNKNFTQLAHIFALLNLQWEFSIKKAARPFAAHKPREASFAQNRLPVALSAWFLACLASW